MNLFNKFFLFLLSCFSELAGDGEFFSDRYRETNMRKAEI